MKKRTTDTTSRNKNWFRIRFIAFLLPSLILLGGFLYSMSNTPPDIRQTVQATIRCESETFQGEAVLVTHLDKPLEFRCNVDTSSIYIENGYIPAPAEYQWSAASGQIHAKGDQCSWSDPHPGLQTIHASGTLVFLPPSTSKPKIICQFSASLACMVPLKADRIIGGKINGFEIGVYPDPYNPADRKKAGAPERILAHADIYSPPKLFYIVTPETYFVRIFNDYTLGEFDLDPRFIPLDYPRYIAINPKLLQKMDLLHRQLIADGVYVSKFKIIYGFRSPAYNIGSWKKDGDETLKEPFSAHMYGLALDFIVDEDNDYVIDDLNRDGKIDFRDAQVLLRAVDKVDNQLLAQRSDLVGGAGYYYHHDFWERGRFVQSPYVHMDIRGHTREDGSLIRWTGKDTIGVLSMKSPYRHQSSLPPHPLLNP
jgi:uncharacterized protein YcbK (DUF882 family)